MTQTARNDFLQVSLCPRAGITAWEVFQQALSAPIFNQHRPRRSCKVRRNAGMGSVAPNRAEVVSLPFSANSPWFFFVDHTQMVLISFQKALVGILRCLLFAFFSTSPFPSSSESREDVEKTDEIFFFPFSFFPFYFSFPRAISVFH